MRLRINRSCSVAFNDVIRHNNKILEIKFLSNPIFLLKPAPHKIFQKKKGKKRKPSHLVEGFKKASFSEKILPDTC